MENLELNAKLQKKKQNLRNALAQKGVLQKKSENTYDHYKYFSEAQYKELFTNLFSEHGLELKFTVDAYDTFEGTEKQANGRMTTLRFTLMDTETGFGEESVVIGEGIDKGDKAGYKAYTGALKYYLANTFMVATNDDPEKESPEAKMNTKIKKERIDQIKVNALLSKCMHDGVPTDLILKHYKVKKIEDLTEEQYYHMVQYWDNFMEMIR